MNSRFIPFALALSIGAGVLVGCNTVPKTQEAKVTLANRADDAIAEIQRTDPVVRQMIQDARGYAIFPRAGKGGAIIAGGFGRGEVYEQGQFIGYAKMEQASVGPQIGGQSFDQLIIFQDQNAMERFKRGEWAPEATASAVILRSGVAVTADYKEGVAVFIRPEAGAMAEVSIGGQRFTFEPASRRSMDME